MFKKNTYLQVSKDPLFFLQQVLRAVLETNHEKLEQSVDQIMKVKNIKPEKDPRWGHFLPVASTPHQPLCYS